MENPVKFSCPSCEGVMLKIEEEWICQRPCGFRSSSSNPEAWMALAMVLSLHRMATQFVAKYDAALPSSNIRRDFKKFLEREG